MGGKCEISGITRNATSMGNVIGSSCDLYEISVIKIK
jgi:hypothetical protein